MCGRYTLSRGDRIVEVVPNVTVKVDLRDQVGEFLAGGRWNIAPTQAILAVANAEELVTEPMRWGLVPAWAKDLAIGNKMINARVETLADKPVFRKCLERRRCVIPADGFYEWKACAWGGEGEKPKKPNKTPMYIRMKDGHAFGFAGLWERWRNPENAGEEIHSCTIITTGPNELMRDIHDRMPAILPREAVLDWLDPHPRDAREMVEWLKPYPADEMEAFAVGRLVNSPKMDGAELIDRAKEEAAVDVPGVKVRKKKSDAGQGQLF